MARKNSFTVLVGLIACVSFSGIANAKCPDIFNFTANKLRSEESIDFCKAFAGKPVLAVNTASQCGYTPQFKALEELHAKYGGQIAIVGFPSGDFKQEFDDQEKVAEVCYKNYGVTFTMLAPSSVKGNSANAFYQALANTTGESPSWNFNKYLISADGKNVEYFGSSTKPMGETMLGAVERAIESAQTE